MRKPILQLFYFLGFVFILLLLSIGCTTQRSLIIHDDLPPEAKKGFVEFFCFKCMTGFSIFRIEEDKEIFLAQLRTGRQVAASVKSPVRLRRLRIAHIPGEFEFEIKLYGFDPVRRKDLIAVKVFENKLTPIQLNFAEAGGGNIYFGFEKGTPVPLENHPEIFDLLDTLLSDPSWPTFWYAIQVSRKVNKPVSTNVIKLLETYSSETFYQTCIQEVFAGVCSELRAQAKISLEKIKAKQ